MARYLVSDKTQSIYALALMESIAASLIPVEINKPLFESMNHFVLMTHLWDINKKPCVVHRADLGYCR